jgi:DNA helicase-2/ATP-dependent DNA helicase PcrA
MRLPPISDLDQTQRALYADAPQDGSILIYGPPGTGKSVIAIHRAMRLAKTNQPVVLVMFNQVLAQYSKAAGDLPSNVIISTMYSWIDKWFYTAFGHGMPKVDRFTPLTRYQVI